MENRNRLTIHTERLFIRNLKITDLANFHFYRSNPEVTKYQGFDVLTIEQAEAFIRSQMDKTFGQPGEWVQYGIEDRQSGNLIGDCAIKLHQQDTRIGEIGITISHAEQRKGYAKEALIGLVNYLFSIDGFHRVVEIVDAENLASIQLLERVGFKREGHFIENIFFKGKWGSEYQYAMLEKEWRENVFSKK